jgi:hypothetical protein
MVAAFRDPLLNCYSTAVSQHLGSSMTMAVRSSDGKLVFEQSKDPTYDIKKQHPAYYPQLTKEKAEKLLIGTLPMTYILWTMQVEQDGAIEEQYYLSYTKSNLKAAHQLFCNPNCADKLSNLIPQIMHCKPNECEMLLNPCHFRK